MDELNAYEEVLPPVPVRAPAKPSTQIGNVKAKIDRKKKDTTCSNLKTEDTSDDKHNVKGKFKTLPSGLSTSLPAIHKHKSKTDEHVSFGAKLIQRFRRLISSDSEDKTKQHKSDKVHNTEVKRPQNEYQANPSNKKAKKPVRSRSHSDLESWVLPKSGSEDTQDKNSSDEDGAFRLDGIPDVTCLDNRPPISVPEKKDEDYINVKEEVLVPLGEYSEPYEVSDLKLKTKEKPIGKVSIPQGGKITVTSKDSTGKSATKHDVLTNDRDKGTNLDDYINVQEKIQPPNINALNAQGGKITMNTKGSREESATKHVVLSNESDENTILDDYINVQENLKPPIIKTPKPSGEKKAKKSETEPPIIKTPKPSGEKKAKKIETEPPIIKTQKPSGEKKAKKMETDKSRERFLELRSKFSETKDSTSEIKSKMSQSNYDESGTPSSEPEPEVQEDKDLPPLYGMTEQECNDSKDDKTVFNVKDLSIEEVCEKLDQLNLGKYVDFVKKNKIDGVILSVLTEEDFVSELGMKKLEAVRLFAFTKSGHVPK